MLQEWGIFFIYPFQLLFFIGFVLILNAIKNIFLFNKGTLFLVCIINENNNNYKP